MKKYNLDEIKEKKYVPKGYGYNNGNYYVARINDKNTLLDCNGNIMDYPLMLPNNSIRMEYFGHIRFKHLCRFVSNGEKVGIVDKKGNLVVPYVYKTITQHLNGNFTAETFDGEEITIKEEDLIKGSVDEKLKDDDIKIELNK